MLRWGILAPGFIAGRFTNAIHAHTDQRAHAVGSRSLDRAQAFAQAYDISRAHGSYQDLVDDPGIDAVYVASPHSHHREHALAAIAAGKHVLVEKPMAATAAQAEDIADAAAAAGVYAMEAMHPRFHPRTTVITQLLGDGALGEVSTLSAELGFAAPVVATSRLYAPELAGGAILDLGVYNVWFAHLMMGEPETVLARGMITGTGVDSQSTVIASRGPTLATLTSSMLTWAPSHAAINGAAGRIELDGRHPLPGSFTLFGPDNQPHVGFEDPTGISLQDGLCRQAVWMAAEIGQGQSTPQMHPLRTSIQVLRTIDEVRSQLGTTDPTEA